MSFSGRQARRNRCPNCGAPFRSFPILITAAGQFNPQEPIHIEAGSILVYRHIPDAPPPHFIDAPPTSCEYCDTNFLPTVKN